MTVEEKTTYTATSLPGAPPRDTRAEAEADEARGVELAAYLAVLPTLTEEQWGRVAEWVASRGTAWDAAWDAAWDVAWFAARDAARDASRSLAWIEARRAVQVAACAFLVASWDAPQDAATHAAWAIIVRDLITPDQFDTLTAPMRAAGINFDGLTNHANWSER